MKERKHCGRKKMQQKNEIKWKIKHGKRVSGTTLHDNSHF